jgi:hypothetical protein
MKKPLLLLAATSVVLLPAATALAGGFGHHIYNPHFYGGRAPVVRGHCGPTFHHRPSFRSHCGPGFFDGGFVSGGFGGGHCGDTFGGFVNHGVFHGGNGFVAVNRGRLTVGVPFQLPNKCGVGFSKKSHGGFSHFSGVHNFYASSSSPRDYASFHAAKQHGPSD